MTTTWILVADNARARIFSAETSTSPLVEIDDLVHTEGRLHDREITQDLPGKIKNPGGISGHAYEQPTDPKKHEAGNFVNHVVHYLEDAHNANRFFRLLVIAEPSTLGLLRKELPNQIKKIVAFELDKNLTAFKPDEIRSHLPDYLPQL
ncbi:MAG: host attachment protein [Gammaproteobacteria bacterium]